MEQEKDAEAVDEQHQQLKQNLTKLLSYANSSPTSSPPIQRPQGGFLGRTVACIPSRGSPVPPYWPSPVLPKIKKETPPLPPSATAGVQEKVVLDSCFAICYSCMTVLSF